MTAVALKPPPLSAASEAARVLGKRGGRPRGSFSSPLAIWLRAEVSNRKREGYGCREAFSILADTEKPTGRHAFTVTDWTADAHDLDIGARVTLNYWRRLWQGG